MVEYIETFFQWLMATVDTLGSRLTNSADLETVLGSWHYMIFAGIFVGALLTYEGLRQFLKRGEHRSEAVNRRIQMLNQGKDHDEILALLKPQEKRGLLGNLPFYGDLNVALNSAGVYMPAEAFLVACGFGFVFAGAAGSQIAPAYMAFPVAALIFLVLPLLAVKHLHYQRLKRLNKQLPDALDLMSRGLRVGHPINTTLMSVAEEMPDPIGTEFGLIVSQVSYGDELVDAMADMADRIDDEDVRYLAIAIAMQHGSGGDLARVLSTLARVIRARIKLRRKVRAVSSEGRLTAYILSALPVAIAVFMTLLTPSYYGDVMDYPMFWPVMSVIAVALVVNAMVLFKLVNFRI